MRKKVLCLVLKDFGVGGEGWINMSQNVSQNSDRW